MLLDESISRAREVAKEPAGGRPMISRFGDVVLAHVLGIGDDPRVGEMTRIVVDGLSPARWSSWRETASDYSVADAWEALALARWLDTGELQPESYRQAHVAVSRYFEKEWSSKKKWPVEEASRWVALACGGEAFAEVIAFVERPQLRDRGPVDPVRVRTALDYGQLLARSRLHGEPTAETLVAAGRKLLKNQIASALEGGGYSEAARFAYLAALSDPDDATPRERLAHLTDHVSYLATKTEATPKRKAAPQAAPSVPIVRRPLPPIALSAVHFETGHAPTWTETKSPAGSQWSLRAPNDRDLAPSRDRRFPLLYEIQTRSHDLATSPLLTKLVRGTLDGEMLSTLAARPKASSLEVAFPFGVSNYFDGSQVQVPPKLSRGIWRAALGVGSLVNLRAISFNAAETDKERLARGAKPYVVGAPWFWDSPLAKQLEALDVAADPHDLSIWRDRFRALPRLGRVHLRVRTPAPNNGYGYLCRFVFDRDGDRIRLTLQGAASPVGVDAATLATLFGGTAGMFSSLSFERLKHPVTDATAIAQLLGAYGEVGEIRGEARLLEL